MNTRVDSNNYQDREFTLSAQNNKDNKSILVLKRAIKLNPRDFAPYRRLAYLYKRNKNYEEAANQYKILLRVYPYSSSSAIECATLLYYNLDKGEEASQVYEEALKANPSDRELYNKSGWLYRLQEKYDKAIEKYQAVIDLYNGDKDAYNNWGVSLYHQEKYDEAVLKFQKAIDMDSHQSNFYFNWGLVLQQQSKLFEAHEMYDKGLQIVPDSIYPSMKSLIDAITTELGNLEKKKNAASDERRVMHIQGTIDGMKIIMNLARQKIAGVALEHGY